MGSITQLIRADTRQVVARYDYDAFGNTTKQEGAPTTFDALDQAQVDQPFRFQSHWQEQNTGLYDFGFRFYSPGSGRFWNQDPIEESGGLNLYGFVGGNPTNDFDEDGLFPIYGGAIDVNALNASDASQTVAAFKIVFSTPKGREMLAIIRASKNPVSVWVGPWSNAYGEHREITKPPRNNPDLSPNCPDPAGKGRGNEIWVNPVLKAVVNTSAGPQVTPYDVQIAHELGHVVYAIPDGGPGRMANVNRAEIPYRAQRRRQLLGAGVAVGSKRYNAYTERKSY